MIQAAIVEALASVTGWPVRMVNEGDKESYKDELVVIVEKAEVDVKNSGQFIEYLCSCEVIFSTTPGSPAIGVPTVALNDASKVYEYGTNKIRFSPQKVETIAYFRNSIEISLKFTATVTLDYNVIVERVKDLQLKLNEG